MGIISYRFKADAAQQWLEQSVSPPQDLAAFTMIFQILTNMLFSKPVQIACYGDRGEDCRLSVVINANSTLEMVVESKQ